MNKMKRIILILIAIILFVGITASVFANGTLRYQKNESGATREYNGYYYQKTGDNINGATYSTHNKIQHTFYPTYTCTNPTTPHTTTPTGSYINKYAWELNSIETEYDVCPIPKCGYPIKTDGNGNKIANNNNNLIYLNEISMGLHWNNVYCVDYNQHLAEEKLGSVFESVGKVEIHGNDATFYKYENGNYVKIGTSTSSLNNQLAAIVSSKEIAENERGHRVGWEFGRYPNNDGLHNRSEYTRTQLLLYKYWNTWQSSAAGTISGISNIFDACNDANLASILIANKAGEKYGSSSHADLDIDNIVDGKKYSATIYSLQYNASTLKHNYFLWVQNSACTLWGLKNNGVLTENSYPVSAGGNSADTFVNQQNMILVQIPVYVKKEWVDGENPDRPDSVEVELIADDKPTGKILTLTAASGWEGKFENLDPDVKYSVREINVPSGYQVEEPIAGNQNEGFVITNKLNEIDLEVKKEWTDLDNKFNTRPSSIKVQLLKNGVVYETVELKSSKGWKHLFEDLDATQNWTVEEVVPTGYTKTTIPGTQTAGYTIKNTLIPTTIPVSKKWNDNNNASSSRPESIKVKLLYKDGNSWKERGIIKTLNKENGWSSQFTGVPKYNKDGSEVQYKVEEVVPTGYLLESSTGNQKTGFTITNVKTIDIPVTKVWNDNGNSDKKRPKEITIKLFADGKVKDTITLKGESNQWKYTFKDLPKYNKDGSEVQYKVEEVVPAGYLLESSTGDKTKGFTITNVKTIDILITKVWNDDGNSDGKRPKEITIKLFADGKEKKTIKLNGEGNQWKYTFRDLPKYNKDGSEIKYTITENAVNRYDTSITGNQKDGFTITNTYYHGYVEINGIVWEDGAYTKANEIDGVYDSKTEKGIEGIKVTLKDKEGNDFKTNGKTYTTTTNSKGKYTIKVNYDNSQGVYKLYEDAIDVKERLKTAYVEFEYNGVTYTTVKTAKTGANTSKAKENETQRTTFDTTYSTITPQTVPTTEAPMTAATKDVISFESYKGKTEKLNKETIKICTGNGKDKFTNTIRAWNKPQTGTHSKCGNKCKNPMETWKVDVEKINNVNLGLFIRENPKIGLGSDVSKVVVKMNNQDYTYLYGHRGNATNGLKIKYDNQNYYTNSQEYARPINVSDIAYLNKINGNAMDVYVVYEVMAENLSNTLKINVNEIINFYDKNYTVQSVINKRTGATVSTTKAEESEFNTLTLKNLNFVLEPQNRSDVIEITYKVNKATIMELLQEKPAVLNHGSEIISYTTQYGAKTLYAEQGKGGRTGKPYAGYDYSSHPGNAGFKVTNNKLEAAKLEWDTDIAPGFVLKPDDPKTIAGTVFEDKDANLNDEARLGNGKYDKSTEKTVQNVKVELCNMDGTTATLYEKLDSQGIPAVTYTDANGNYSLTGIVTGEYFLKYTYGDDTEKLGHDATKVDGNPLINARNYKSTIITSEKLKEIFKLDYSNANFDKNWHINIEDGYSVAVDNMIERLAIEDLQHSNFDNKLNMTAFTKPFKTEIEFDADGQGQADKNGELDGLSNIWDRLDFGIVERPREDLFVNKTITYMKLVLANGQTLIDGDPRTQQLNYAKTMGFQQEINSGEAARLALPKRLLIEMDVELIQGAKLEVHYQIEVTNNNELDYDYGLTENYTDIVRSDTANVNDKFITKNNLANYYYYGDSTGLSEMKSTLEFVDYLNSDVIYEVDTTKWNVINALDLRAAGNELVSEEAYKKINDAKYKIFMPKEKITLERGKKWLLTDMVVNKSLANKDENVYDNCLEILKIDGKTARTVRATESGTKIDKLYKPGNYIPLSSNTEQDDDVVEIIITPPTGAGNYIITYLVAGVAGLIVLAVAIIFIKKKVLTK